MKISTDGLIIGEQDIGEKDRLVTVLTREKGIIRAFVKNCKSLKSSKGTATRLLCYSRLSVFFGRDTYIIDDAVCKEMFINLRNDIINMSLAQYFCEIALYFSPQETNAESYLKLMLNALYLLSNNKRLLPVIKSAVEFRIMSYSGYMPNLVSCSECNCYENEIMYFLPRSGKLICKDCISSNREYKIALDMSVVTAMRYCIYAEPKKMFNFKLPQSKLKLLEKCSEEYIMYITEHKFKTLDFYKNINNYGEKNG